MLSAGDIYKSLGKYDDAIKYWDAAYIADNESPECLYSKVFCYQELGENEKAIEVWKEIIEWLEKREFDLDVAFPQRELQKLIDKCVN